MMWSFIRVLLLLPFILKYIGNSSTNEHTEEDPTNNQLYDEVITNENVDEVLRILFLISKPLRTSILTNGLMR